LGLSSSKVLGNPLDLLFSRVVLYSGIIGNSTIDHLCVYLSGIEQAIPLYRYSEPSKSELLGSELLLYSSKVTLLLEFIVNLDAQKPGLLDRGNYLLVKVNRHYRSYIGIGKVDKFTLFWSKLYSLYLSLLAIDLPGALKVLASRLYIPAEYKEV
jgi:hypothetical protein